MEVSIMYRKVEKAWVLLNPNNGSSLHVLFDEDWTQPLVDFEDRLVCLPQSNGMVFYGAYDSAGKRWSSRAGVINRMYPQYQIIDIVEVDRDHNGMGRSTAVTKEFAKQILKDFNLPFHFVVTEDNEHDLRWDLEQDDREQWINKSVKTLHNGKVKVRQCTWSPYGSSECIIVEDANGKLINLTYAAIPKMYRGTTWQDYQKDLITLGVKSW
ncbi:MAG: hypothetical protein NC489_08035 [Ruminococcus flavefaciens]|nr:hypothetical protein [Ruminococcus flavefaciens]